MGPGRQMLDYYFHTKRSKVRNHTACSQPHEWALGQGRHRPARSCLFCGRCKPWRTGDWLRARLMTDGRLDACPTRSRFSSSRPLVHSFTRPSTSRADAAPAYLLSSVAVQPCLAQRWLKTVFVLSWCSVKELPALSRLLGRRDG